MLLANGTTLQNRYKIVREIAQGGMGAVYEAKDQTLGKRVALKQMLHHNQQAQQAFKREGLILANLSHPALPDVSHYFVENNSQFFVMEYIPSKDLRESLKEQGAFPIPQVLDWADQLLDVLEYLHGQPVPIIHRDIKPANIKLSPREEIILLDFGISKGGQIHSGHLPTDDLTRDKSVQAYTEKYAPPEQIYYDTRTDERSDLYALGTTLYELLTNKEPTSALSRLQNQDDDPLSFDNLVKNHHPDLPVGVLDVLARAMALDPNERPSNAKEMRQMLQRVSRSHVQAQDTLDSITSIPVPLAEPKEAKTQTVPDKQTSTGAIPTQTIPPTEPLTHLSDDKPFSGPSWWRSRPAVIAMGAVLVSLIAVFYLISQSKPCNKLDIDSFIINNNVKVELGEPYTVTDTTEGLLIKANLDIEPLACQEHLTFEWAVLDHENRVIQVQNSTDEVSIHASLVNDSKTIEVSVKEITTAQQAIRSLILKR